MNATSLSATLRAEESSPMMLLPGAVGFYFAARICITYLFFQPDPQTGAIVNFALNLLLLVSVGFYAFGPGNYKLSSMLCVRPFRWVIMFLSVGLCSLLWSSTVSSAIAFGYWIEMAGRVAIILLLLRSGPAGRIFDAVIKGYVTGACFIAIVEWLSPTMSDLRPGNDDFFSPNAIGFTCAFGVFMAQYLVRSTKFWRVAAVFLAISLMRSLSKTTIIAFVISETLLLIGDRSITRKNKALIALIGIAIAIAFWQLLAGYYEIYTNAGNQAETLTGRIGIWAFVLDKSLEQPWIGHGFHSFRNVIPAFGTFEAWHAHNELLQQFYAYGAVGIVLLIGIYGSFFRQVRQLASNATKALFLTLLLFVVVRGLGDTENFDLSLPLWAVALFSLTLARREELSHESYSQPLGGLVSPVQLRTHLTPLPKALQP